MGGVKRGGFCKKACERETAPGAPGAVCLAESQISHHSEVGVTGRGTDRGCVLASCVKLAATPWNVTAVAPWRFGPVIVTLAPTLPLAGEKQPMLGCMLLWARRNTEPDRNS